MQTLLCKCNFASVPMWGDGSSGCRDLKNKPRKSLRARWHTHSSVCVHYCFVPLQKFPLFCFLLLPLCNLVISWILCCVFLEGHGSLRWAARSGRLATTADRLSWQPWCDRCPRLPLSFWRCSGVYLAILRRERSFIIPPLKGGTSLANSTSD